MKSQPLDRQESPTHSFFNEIFIRDFIAKHSAISGLAVCDTQILKKVDDYRQNYNQNFV